MHAETKQVYDRERQLRSRLNTFLRERFGLPERDYYSTLNAESLTELKSVLTDINNIFTLKLTLGFARWLGDKLCWDQAGREQMESKILSAKPNANGYDIEISDPLKIIAEVKCNVPINSGSIYGSAQRNGIAKDLDGLINGKSKSKADPTEYLKFMVLLDTPNVRAATAHLKDLSQYADRLLIDPQKLQTPNDIHVVFIGPNRWVSRH